MAQRIPKECPKATVILLRYFHLDLAFLYFAQRAFTAFRALSLRSSAVSFAARALPPNWPPFFPSLTKNSLISAGSFFLDMAGFYVSPTRIFNFRLEIRKGVTYYQ